MRQKSQILDYEPVTPSGVARSREQPLSGHESHQSGFGVEPNEREPVRPDPPKPSAKPQTQQRRELSAFVKRGHGLSFAGLFLFTFVLYFRPYELFPSLSFLSNIAFWTAILTLAVYVPTQLGLEGSITGRIREVNLALLLGLAGLLSIPLALDKSVAWAGFVDYAKVIAMFVVMANVMRTEKRLRALIYLTFFASLVVSVSAVNDYRLGHLALGERIQGLLGNLFDNPNDLALFLVTMIPIALAMLLGSKAIVKKLLFLACSLVFVAGVIATTSRGGVVGLLAVASVLAWRLARRYRVIFAGTGLALVLLVVVIGPEGIKSRIAKGRDDASVVSRTDLLKRSIFLMSRHPLFGLGINNYVLYSNSSHVTHNAYTQVGSEMGIPAMVIYIMFLVIPIKRLARTRRRTEVQHRGRLYYLGVGIEASLIGYMVTSFFLSVAYLWYAYYLVAYALAVSRLTDQLSSGSTEFTSQLGSSRALTDSTTRPHGPAPIQASENTVAASGN